MATHVIMPALGVAQQTGTLIKWLRSEGQSVSQGEPLMEIETDKATVEIEAPASGILTRVTAVAGDEVPVGRAIALIVAPGEDVPADRAPTAPLALEQDDEPKPKTATTANSGTTVKPRAARPLASPAAKRLAREKGVDLATLKGSGPEGSILIADVQAADELSLPGAVSEAARNIAPLTSMRRIIGARMAQSKRSTPHFYLSMDVDMSAVIKARSEWQERRAERTPSLNDYILFACAGALRDIPRLNSSFTAEGIQLHGEIHLGMAVALEEGLVVPVIRNADGLTLAELAEQSRKLVDKAHGKRLHPGDYEGGTFTVSNLGGLGVDRFIPIINPPQCAILAAGRIAPRVVAEDGMFAIKSLMTATLAADHRIVDGAIGAHFLLNFKQRLESPAA